MEVEWKLGDDRWTPSVSKWCTRERRDKTALPLRENPNKRTGGTWKMAARGQMARGGRQ